MSLDDPEYDETPWEEQFRHEPYQTPIAYRLRAKWRLLVWRVRQWWYLRGWVGFVALCFFLMGIVAGAFAGRAGCP